MLDEGHDNIPATLVDIVKVSRLCGYHFTGKEDCRIFILASLVAGIVTLFPAVLMPY